VEEDKMGRACGTHYDKCNTKKTLVSKPLRQRPLWRPRRRCEDNIKIDLIEIGWDDLDWILLAQDKDQWCAVVYTVMNIQFL
jgi:hypothetical protein